MRAHPFTIEKRLGDVQARAVLCGHSHQQHPIQLPNGSLISIRGASAARPDDDPGADPTCPKGYAMLTIGEQVSAELIAISYDWERPLLAPRPIGDQNGLTAFGPGGSSPVQSRSRRDGDSRLPPFPACLAEAVHQMVANGLSHHKDALFHIEAERVRCNCDSLIQRGPSFATPT